MKLNFKKHGEGPSLIILHGLFGTLDNWQTLGRQYAHHYTTYLVDQRNHGHSPHSDEMSYPAMADDLLEFMNDHGIQKAHLIGHSMGGKTVMFFAQQHPERVDKLIVADMGMKAYPPHHDLIFEAMLTLDLENTGSRSVAETHIRKYFNDQAVIQFLLKNLYWSDEGKMAWRMNLLVLHNKIQDILAAVPEVICEVPTLFIRGSKSNYVSNADMEEIHSCFPNARFETLEAGHWLHAEDPKGFLSSTLAFLS